MTFWRRSALVVFLWLFALSGLVTASEQPVGKADSGPTLQDLRQDATAYGAMYGVSVEEAMRRNELLPAMHTLIADMESLAPARFAGAWIEHTPEYRVVVRYTGDADGLAVPFARAQSAAVPVSIETGTPHSYADLVSGLEKISMILDTELAPVAAEVDVKAGDLLLTSPAGLSPATVADLEAIAGVPVRVLRSELGEEHHTYGGRLLTENGQPKCTTGFSVRNTANGNTGVVTAGHCPGNPAPGPYLTYHQDCCLSYALTRLGERDDADQDAQWMENTQHVDYDDFWDGDSYRDVQLVVTRAAAVGDTVCHYGIGSALTANPPGYSCGAVTSINYKPSLICPAITQGVCDSVWIKVEGSQLACFGGDSGGPWFYLYSAYGIHNGGFESGSEKGQCTWAWFMSQDFLAPMTLEILK